MKKFIYIFLLAGFVSITACEKKLQLEPFDALDVSEAFESNTDFENALKGTYAFMRDGNYFGGEFLLIPDVISDNVIICSEGRFSYQDYYLYNINGNIAWFQFWRAAYDVILRANYILENIDNLEDGDFKDNIQGQALAIRAMAHFDLARVYSKPPQYAAGDDLGVPYVTSTDAALRPSRPSVQETFDNIEQDFNAAINLIGDDNGVGFLDLAAVHGLRSRYYLYIGDKVASNAAADDAIAAAQGGEGVASIDDFPLIWTDQTESGVMFKVINTDLDGVGVGVVYNQGSPDGIRSEYVPDFNFYQGFGATDVRRDAYFETSPFAGFDFNHVIKYIQRPGSDQAVVDMKVLRWSEIYLNKAEALAGTNDGAALAALDEVRSNRYTGFTSPGETGAALIDAIQFERRKELAFEGHRLFDLKRQNAPIVRTDAGDYADGTGNNPDPSVLVLPATSVKFQMPIPQEELNANENMQPNPSNG